MSKKEIIDIDALKAQYGEIKEISTGDLTAYFRKPDMKIWRYALKAISTSQTAFKSVMAKSCYVAGSKELIESPYLEDVAELINDFIDYEEADVEKEGNGYRITVLDKSCRLRPVSIEIQTEAERGNPDDIAFKTQQNMLDSMWIDGDVELKDSKNLDYHMPVLRVLKNLREKHVLKIKNA